MDEGYVFQKVHFDELHPVHIESRTVIDIAQHFYPLIRVNEIDAFVDDLLEILMLQGDAVVKNVRRHEDNAVGQEKLQHMILHRGQGIDDAEGDANEKISHLPHRHRHRAITENGKDGKESEGKPDLQLCCAQEETDQ